MSWDEVEPSSRPEHARPEERSNAPRPTETAIDQERSGRVSLDGAPHARRFALRRRPGCAQRWFGEATGHHHVGGVGELAGGERFALGGDDAAILTLSRLMPVGTPVTIS
jgi:hypothetical protein